MQILKLVNIKTEQWNKHWDVCMLYTFICWIHVKQCCLTHGYRWKRLPLATYHEFRRLLCHNHFNGECTREMRKYRSIYCYLTIHHDILVFTYDYSSVCSYYLINKEYIITLLSFTKMYGGERWEATFTTDHDFAPHLHIIGPLS